VRSLPDGERILFYACIFLDGNKRTAGMAMFTFLQLNALEPIAKESDYYITMMSLATGNMSKEQLADWLRTAVNVTPPDLYEK
jgi:death on curing protein